MLTKAVVRNFQKHKKLIIRFDPRVTTVVGKTDAGKSSFLRALQFALFSKWSPRYHRHGTDTAVVDLYIDGKRVRRVKAAKGRNGYTVDGKTLNAVGKGGVPPEVSKLFNLSGANVQSQLDPVFWFSETPGAIGKKLNKVVNLEQIDSVQAKAGAAARDAARDRDAAKARLDTARKEYRAAAAAEDAIRFGTEALRLSRRLKRTDRELRELKSLVRSAVSLTTGLSALEEAAALGGMAVRLGREAADWGDRAADLRKLIENAEAAERGVPELPDFGPVRALRRKADIIADDCARLEGLVRDVDDLTKKIGRYEERLTAATARLAALKKKEKRCPKCGQKIVTSLPRR